jgi:hypothetical protein
MRTPALMNPMEFETVSSDSIKRVKPIPIYTTIVYGEGMDAAVMNAISIQLTFGLSHIVPDWNGEANTMEKGALHLIAEQPALTREAMESLVGYELRVIPVATAKEMVEIDGREWK